jgi:hypothetical protein
MEATEALRGLIFDSHMVPRQNAPNGHHIEIDFGNGGYRDIGGSITDPARTICTGRVGYANCGSSISGIFAFVCTFEYRPLFQLKIGGTYPKAFKNMAISQHVWRKPVIRCRYKTSTQMSAKRKFPL